MIGEIKAIIPVIIKSSALTGTICKTFPKGVNNVARCIASAMLKPM